MNGLWHPGYQEQHIIEMSMHEILNKQVQKLARIYSECQSRSKQLGSTQIEQKIKSKI